MAEVLHSAGSWVARESNAQLCVARTVELEARRAGVCEATFNTVILLCSLDREGTSVFRLHAPVGLPCSVLLLADGTVELHAARLAALRLLSLPWSPCALVSGYGLILTD